MARKKKEENYNPIEVNPLVQFKNADEVQKEFDQKLKEMNPSSDKEHLLLSLATHIRDKWQQAQEAKVPIEARLNACKRTIKQQYDPRKLAAIQALYGKDFDPPYPPVIATKKDDLVAWLKDAVLMSGIDLFSLEPTPMPDLPGNMETAIEQKTEQRFYQIAASQSLQSGLPVDPRAIAQQIKELQPIIKDKILEEIKQRAKEAVLRMKNKIKDQFAEGNFDIALKEFIDDIATYPNAFIKGPVLKKAKVQKRNMDVETGQWTTTTVEETINFYERVSPYNIYPARNTGNINDTDLIELISLTPSNLSDLMGVEGYDTEAIREVIRLYRKGGLREWTNITSERDQLEDKGNSSFYDLLDCIAYQGTASGQMLTEWAGKDKVTELFGQELDPEKEYQIIGWLIGTHVIKAMLNPDPLGQKNISMTSCYTDADNFWSPSSIPEKLWSDQSQCNALSRAIVLNVGFAAGPQVEYDKDRFPEGVVPNFYPLKMWPATGAQMAGGKAVNFYQPQLVVNALTQAFEFYRSLADEHSGIPRYMQGERTGMAGTASGFSMQLSAQSRGLKSISINIYSDVISKLVERQYQFNLEYEDIEMIGDCKIIPSGLSSIVAKEQLALRRKEYLNEVTTNPVRTQIIGAKGLRYMEKQTAQVLDFDLDKIFGEDSDIMEDVIDITGLPTVNRGTPPATVNVNAAGGKAGGVETALFNEKAGQSSVVG